MNCQNLNVWFVCPHGKNWGDGLFEYPAFQFDFLNKREYTDTRVVTLEEFNRIRVKITKGGRTAGNTDSRGLRWRIIWEGDFHTARRFCLGPAYSSSNKQSGEGTFFWARG